MTMTMTMTMNEKKKWEIWLAKVHFDDYPEIFKVRPVLLTSSEADSDGNFVCLFITSKEKKGPKDYTIRKWKEAGLKKESTITSRILKIPPKDFGKKKVGQLSLSDIWEVEARWTENWIRRFE